MTHRQGLISRSILVAILAASVLSCRPKPRSLSAHDLTVLGAGEAVVRLFQMNPGAVWPGYDLSRQPFLLYIPDKWAILLNPPQGKAVEGFSALPAGWPDLGIPALYHEGQYQDLVGQLVFSYPVAGVELAAIGIPEGLIKAEGFPNTGVMDFIIHENFHEFQDKNFGEIPWEREERYPILDAANTTLAYLELALLEDAIEPAYAGDRKTVEEITRLFTAVRRERWNKGPSFVRRYEQGQEIREGTAQYVQMRCVDLVKGMTYRSAIGSKDISDILRGLSPAAIRRKDFETRMANHTVQPDDMIRNRIYPVGATLGFLADALGVAWKDAAQKAGLDFAFLDILAKALPPDDRSDQALLEEAKGRYGYDTVLKATKKSIASYKEGFEQALKAFDSQPGIRIEIGFSYRSLSRSRVGAGRKWVVDDGARSLGQTFRVFTLKNTDLTLEAREKGILENDDWDAKTKRVAIYVPEITSLKIDGAAKRLDPSAAGAFKTLEMAGPDFALSVKTSGTLVISGRDLNVNLKSPQTGPKTP